MALCLRSADDPVATSCPNCSFIPANASAAPTNFKGITSVAGVATTAGITVQHAVVIANRRLIGFFNVDSAEKFALLQPRQ